MGDASKGRTRRLWSGGNAVGSSGVFDPRADRWLGCASAVRSSERVRTEGRECERAEDADRRETKAESPLFDQGHLVKQLPPSSTRRRIRLGCTRGRSPSGSHSRRGPVSHLFVPVHSSKLIARPHLRSLFSLDHCLYAPQRAQSLVLISPQHRPIPRTTRPSPSSPLPSASPTLTPPRRRHSSSTTHDGRASSPAHRPARPLALARALHPRPQAPP